MPTDYPSTILDTPYGPLRATMQGPDVVHLVNDQRHPLPKDVLDAPLVIRNRPAYFNGHVHYVGEGHGPETLERGGWVNGWARKDGAYRGVEYVHRSHPSWIAANLDQFAAGNTFMLAAAVTGPATLDKFDATIAAAVAAWVTDEMRDQAAAARNGDNAAALRDQAARLRALAADFDALADSPEPPAGLSYITDLHRAEMKARELAAKVTA